jgi:small subunit ribosomal protein S11
MSEEQLAAADTRLHPPSDNINIMGKKRIIQKTEKELVEEGDKIEAAVKKEGKIQSSKKIKEGRIYIASSYNNTIITLADLKGNVLSWASAGNIGFKGTKKATAFAASKVAEAIIQRIRKIGIEKVEIFVKGIGSGRDSAVRSLANKGLEIISIEDVTPIPHNGCKPPKARRV